GGDVDEAALLARGPPLGVLRPAAAHEGEDLVARLGDLGGVVEDGGVVLGELDRPAVDAALAVAPLDEGLAGVEELLVEPRLAGEARIGDRADGDGVVAHAGGVAGCRGRVARRGRRSPVVALAAVRR